MVRTVFREVMTGNNVIVVRTGNNRNENSLTIHNNSIGKTLYKNEKIYDSDVLKLVRTLEQYQYNRISFKDLINKMNKNCRHLDIIYIDNYTLF